VIAVVESGMDNDGVSRVLQGLVTGIGFLGGGAILKLQQQREVEEPDHVAGIWLMAAVRSPSASADWVWQPWASF
jgi:putative Mg2+ transporter-C (MgtC) family protein